MASCALAEKSVPSQQAGWRAPWPRARLPKDTVGGAPDRRVRRAGLTDDKATHLAAELTASVATWNTTACVRGVVSLAGETEAVVS